MSIFSYIGKICNVLANAKGKLQNSHLWKIFIEKKSERFHTKMYVVVWMNYVLKLSVHLQ